MHNWKDVIDWLIAKERCDDLWNYCSALRGPDGQEFWWKKIMTCLIRGEAPSRGVLDIHNLYNVLHFGDYLLVDRLLEDIPGKHFFVHIQSGIEVLEKYYRLKEDRDKCNSLKNIRLKLHAFIHRDHEVSEEDVRLLLKEVRGFVS